MEELKSMADLLDLQVVDSAIDKLLDDRGNLPALAQYRTAHTAAVAAAATQTTCDATLRSLNLAVDKTEGELVLAEEKLQQKEQRLFAGGMNAKETENMRMDVDSLRRQKSTMEDELLDLFEQRNTAEAEAKDATEVAETSKSAERSLEAEIATAWREIDAEVARKEARKGGIAPEVDEELMELYTELRNSRGGVVVGGLDGRTCGACFIELSAAEHYEALQEHPPRCIHCGSILVP
jgi:predicted  nucleic acid-binding Zn-ribbon protein